MEQKSKFDKVMGAQDILVIAFGAMIGWGWVINSGDWITTAGFAGSIIAMLIGGLMVFFVGLTYAELTSAMPQCGGEHVFSYRAMGPTGSFVCTWMIILGYVATSAFEATALPTVITYLFPDFNQVYLYSIAGKDIYLTTIVLGVGVAILITVINIKGAKTAAILQTVLTAIIAIAGILLVVGSAINGDMGNITGQMWESGAGNTLGSVFKVACMTPFLFIGFDVIPQAAEEINVPYKKIGKIMLLSIFLAVAWYLMIIFAVCYIMPQSEIAKEMMSQNGLVDYFGIEYYDRDLVDKVVQEIGVDKGLVEEADTKIGVRYAFDTSYGVRYANLSNRVIDAQFQAIHDFAKHSCVIVGRSSDYILRDTEDVMNVFIYAPQKDEIAAVMKKKGLNERKAEEEWENVEKSQHARHEYITGKKRGDRHTRDILLNSSLLGWDATAQFIEELVERRFGLTEETLKKEAQRANERIYDQNRNRRI